MNEKLWWFTARSGGLMAWWLVAASVLFGLFLSTRVLQGKPKPAWLLDLHRFLGGLSVLFTGIHVAALMADSYVDFGISDVLVPMASRWKPGPVAWGVVGFYLLIAIEVTSLFMRRIPRTWWRRVHATSFVLFVLSSAHAFTAGTDKQNAAVQWSALVMGALFVFLMTYRQAAATSRRRPKQASAPTG